MTMDIRHRSERLKVSLLTTPIFKDESGKQHTLENLLLAFLKDYPAEEQLKIKNQMIDIISIKAIYEYYEQEVRYMTNEMKRFSEENKAKIK